MESGLYRIYGDNLGCWVYTIVQGTQINLNMILAILQASTVGQGSTRARSALVRNRMLLSQANL